MAQSIPIGFRIHYILSYNYLLVLHWSSYGHISHFESTLNSDSNHRRLPKSRSRLNLITTTKHIETDSCTFPMFFSHFRHFPGTQQLLPTTILLEFTQNNTGGRVQSWKSAFLGVARSKLFFVPTNNSLPGSARPNETVILDQLRRKDRPCLTFTFESHSSHVPRLSNGERRWFQYKSNESALAVSWDEARGTYVASRWSGPESNMAAVVFVVIALLALAHLDLPLPIVLFLSIILSCWCWTSIALKTTTTTTFFDHDLNQYRISFSLFFYFLNVQAQQQFKNKIFRFIWLFSRWSPINIF